MQIRVHTIDGITHVGDSETLAAIREAAGNPDQFEFAQAIQDSINVIQKVGGLDSLTIKVKGVERGFNPAHIVWTEVDLEGETLPDVEAEMERRRQERTAHRRTVRGY